MFHIELLHWWQEILLTASHLSNTFSEIRGSVMSHVKNRFGTLFPLLSLNVLYVPFKSFFLRLQYSESEICNYNQVLVTADKVFGGLKVY